MKKSIADKWIKELRNGKYNQTKYQLKDDNGYCCLGVLCDISNLDKFDDNNFYLKRNRWLPDKVIKFAHLKSANGKLNNLNTYLSSLNDGIADEIYENSSLTLNFNEIADIIQINWKDL